MSNFNPTPEGFDKFATQQGYKGTGKTRTKNYAQGTLYLRHFEEGVEFRRISRTGQTEAKLFIQV